LIKQHKSSFLVLIHITSIKNFILKANTLQPNIEIQGQRHGILLLLKDFINQVNILIKSGTDAPGSGNYFPVNDLSDSGKYVLSTNKGQGKRRLDK
jgi:hypothetical protein